MDRPTATTRRWSAPTPGIRLADQKMERRIDSAAHYLSRGIEDGMMLYMKIAWTMKGGKSLVYATISGYGVKAKREMM